MIISINQPAFLPWLGYFDRIDFSQIHVELDHVQFEKNSFTNRNKIRSTDNSIWITIPVKTKNRFKNLAINTVEIDNRSNWKKKHINSIKQNYSKTAFFNEYFPEIEHIYMQNWKYLLQIIKALNELFLKWLNIDTNIISSSTLNIKSTKSELLLDICKHFNAKCYASGILGKNYLDESIFKENKIEIVYQKYLHPEYNQYQKGYFPNMSVLDLLFNYGKESMEIIKKGRNIIK